MVNLGLGVSLHVHWVPLFTFILIRKGLCFEISRF